MFVLFYNDSTNWLSDTCALPERIIQGLVRPEGLSTLSTPILPNWLSPKKESSCPGGEMGRHLMWSLGCEPLSPFLPFPLSPFLPFSLSPFLPFFLSPFLFRASGVQPTEMPRINRGINCSSRSAGANRFPG